MRDGRFERRGQGARRWQWKRRVVGRAGLGLFLPSVSSSNSYTTRDAWSHIVIATQTSHRLRGIHGTRRVLQLLDVRREWARPHPVRGSSICLSSHSLHSAVCAGIHHGTLNADAPFYRHRDFWREVPYMLRDVVSHLCSTVRPRQSSRGGYIAV